MPGVVDGERSNAFHFASPRICHVINSVIGSTLGFRKSRIGQEFSVHSRFRKESAHVICDLKLLRLIGPGVDIQSGGDIRMSKPFLYILNIRTVMNEHAGT